MTDDKPTFTDEEIGQCCACQCHVPMLNCGCLGCGDKPTVSEKSEKAEWERWLGLLAQHELKHRTPCAGCATYANELRAAVQRAIQDAYGDGIEQGILTHTAAEKRARGNDGD